MEDLLNGNLDAVIIDNNPANAYKDQHGDELRLIEDQFPEEQYVLAVNKGNTALLEAVNGALKELQDDGKFDEIVAQYIK